MEPPNAVLLDTLQETLDQGVVRHGVPGASMAVLHAGRIHAVAAGVLNVETEIAVTPDSAFQIGSVTKSFTATLAMMLIEEGRLTLDDLVVTHLPEFTLADGGADAARTIRVKHLLCHVSGIDGDRIEDTGSGDDAIEKFVANLRECRLIHPTGAFFSYCNVGYIILGRILEVIEGKPWDRILRERLLLTLGLASAITTAEDADMQRTAVGHVNDAQGRRQLSTDGFKPKSNGPSGTTLAMSAPDLLRFARFHLDGSVDNAGNGRRLLSAASLQLMRQAHVDIPQSYRYSGWGLGWMLYDWNHQGAFGHDGGWAGQSAYLRICPRADLAVVLLANGGNSGLLLREVVGPILAQYGELVPPPLPEIEMPYTRNLALYAGRYARHGQTITLSVDGSRLVGKISGPYVDGEEGGTPLSLTLIDSNRAACNIDGVPVTIGAYFLEFGPDGRPGYLHVTERAFRRESQR